MKRPYQFSIYIRIIDPAFKGKNLATRHDEIWEILGLLPEKLQSLISKLLLLTPAEVKSSGANMDFENPIPSRL